ncbi:glycoside hydrolase family 172 protein [Mucilaginibacter aquariorum]|uniref:DUF2961 domain-containing protein n=1 Tax=Mucilaginibacter aquariorum TaxID=2967225 RepID=A0ABT1T8Y7_9SPHI|nr:glycoside hydrolase family 172 protein [Mucilaginibacter aquariorum]MCQ6960756.1 DUF2961 domain-containing protein [Mucilaginibacter aquariorum]
MNILKVLLLNLISCFLIVNVNAQAPVTVAGLLNEMTDPDAVAKWPSHAYFLKQASSYDRKSVAPGLPGWCANADQAQYIRTEETEGRKELVMMDADGPGVVVRFWLTTFKRNGTIRIYFDGQKVPEILIPAYDLMQSGLPLGKGLLNPHSSYQPLEKGGNTLYLPLPFAKHCKVTFEDKDIEPKQPRYYQINYRLYEEGTKVLSFTKAQLKPLTGLLSKVENSLWSPPERTGKQLNAGKQLPPGSSFSMVLPAGNGSIRQLVFTVKEADAKKYAQTLRSAVLKMEFDGVQTVWCPIGDFSGSGVGGKPVSSWYRTVDGKGIITSRWVMPYRSSAKLTIENLGAEAVDIRVEATTASRTWTKSSLYFYTGWKQSRHVQITHLEDQATEWNMSTINGKGIYMGNTMAVYNHMHTWYGEGDQKIWVDKDTFPSEFGTGTEDYYNTSWAPVVIYQTPFANAPRADHEDSFGYNTFTRTRILDAVPFVNHFKMDLEMLGWKTGDADFAVTTYWYGSKDAGFSDKPMPEEAAAVLPE